MGRRYPLFYHGAVQPLITVEDREKNAGTKEGRHIGSPCLIKFMKFCMGN